MKTLLLLIILILWGLMSCDKIDEFSPMDKPVYEICNIKIDSIVIWPDTLLEGYDKYLNIRMQHHVFNNTDSNWVWCDIYEQPLIYWGDHKASFLVKISKPDMAIEIKPATCPGYIISFNVIINDSIVRVKKEGDFYRIKL